MATVKSGWLLKLSGFFKNSWKKRYFTLYKDGQFCYYQDPNDKEADGKIHMKIECRRIGRGNDVGGGVKAPNCASINAMFCVASSERTWFLCAETDAECSEWITALEEARKPLVYQSNIGGAGAPMPPYQQPGPGAPPPYPGGPQPGYAPAPYPTQPQPGAPTPYPQANMPYPGQAAPGPYPQQPPVSYPPQSYPYPPQQYGPPPAGYAPQAPPPGQYPRQQYYAPGTTYVQGVPPQQPQTVYVKDKSNKSSGKNNMLMGAAGGAVGGMALGYMMGSAMGGHHHGWGGWDSDHSWSSGGSFEFD